MLSQESVESSERGSSLVMDNDDTSSVKSFSSVSHPVSSVGSWFKFLMVF